MRIAYQVSVFTAVLKRTEKAERNLKSIYFALLVATPFFQKNDTLPFSLYDNSDKPFMNISMLDYGASSDTSFNLFSKAMDEVDKLYDDHGEFIDFYPKSIMAVVIAILEMLSTDSLLIFRDDFEKEMKKKIQAIPDYEQIFEALAEYKYPTHAKNASGARNVEELRYNPMNDPIVKSHIKKSDKNGKLDKTGIRYGLSTTSMLLVQYPNLMKPQTKPVLNTKMQSSAPRNTHK